MRIQTTFLLALTAGVWAQAIERGAFRLSGTSQQVTQAAAGGSNLPDFSGVTLPTDPDAGQCASMSSGWDVIDSPAFGSDPAANKTALQNAINAAEIRRNSSDQSTFIRIPPGTTFQVGTYNSTSDQSVLLGLNHCTPGVNCSPSGYYTGGKLIKVGSSVQPELGQRAGDWGIATITRASDGTVTIVTNRSMDTGMSQSGQSAFAVGTVVLVDKVVDWTFNGWYRVLSHPSATTITLTQAHLTGKRWGSVPAVSSQAIGGFVRTLDLRGRIAWLHTYGSEFDVYGHSHVVESRYGAKGYCFSEMYVRYLDDQQGTSASPIVSLGATIDDSGAASPPNTNEEMPKRLGIQRSWITSYYAYDPQTFVWGSESFPLNPLTPNTAAISNANQVTLNVDDGWITDSWLERGFDINKEDHNIWIFSSNGPLYVVNNGLTSGTEPFFMGGATNPLPNYPMPGGTGAIGVSQNDMTLDPWEMNFDDIHGTPTCTTCPWDAIRKNRSEFKNAQHVIFEANKQGWAFAPDQGGYVQILMAHGNGTLNWYSGVQDIIYRYNMGAHTVSAGQFGATNEDKGSQVKGKRFLIAGNLYWDIGDEGRIGYEATGISHYMQNGANGTEHAWTNVSATADAARDQVTYTVSDTSGQYELILAAGDYVTVYGCSGPAYGSPDSVNTAPGTAASPPSPGLGQAEAAIYLSAQAVADVFMGTSVTVNMPGLQTSRTETGCTLIDNKGGPKGYTLQHNSFFIKTKGRIPSMTASSIVYPTEHAWIDNVIVPSFDEGAGGSNDQQSNTGWWCSKAQTNTGNTDTHGGGCWDTRSLKYYGNVTQWALTSNSQDWNTPAGTTAPSKYPTYAQCNDTAAHDGTDDSNCIRNQFNWRFWDPDAGGKITRMIAATTAGAASNCGTLAANEACITTEFRHGLQVGDVIIEQWQGTTPSALNSESGAYTITAVSADGYSYKRSNTHSSVLDLTGTGGNYGMPLGIVWTGYDMHAFRLCTGTSMYGCAKASAFAATGTYPASDNSARGADVDTIYARWRSRGVTLP